MDKQQPQQPQQPNYNLNIDTTPIFYADDVVWNISSTGVVLNFVQSIMGSNQKKVITRVGMSRELAKVFASLFGKNMLLTEVQGQVGKVKS